MTLLSNLSPRILRILVRPVSTDLRRRGVISHFLAVNSTFMSAPFFPGTTFGLLALAARTARCRPDSRRGAGATTSFLHSAVMGAGDGAVFPIFFGPAAGHPDCPG